jgi:hypothetical protein
LCGERPFGPGRECFSGTANSDEISEQAKNNRGYHSVLPHQRCANHQRDAARQHTFSRGEWAQNVMLARPTCSPFPPSPRICSRRVQFACHQRSFLQPRQQMLKPKLNCAIPNRRTDAACTRWPHFGRTRLQKKLA